MDDRGIDAETFVEALAGDVIDEATAALLEGVVAFFPKRRRETIRRAVELQESVRGAMLDLANKKLDAADPAEIAESLISGRPSTSSQGSSESTPAN